METEVIKLSQKNFHQICRICYQKDDLKNIFQSKYRDVSLVAILEKVLNQKIPKSDGLPANICLKCTKSLLNLNAFLEQYKISSEALKSVYNYLYTENRKKYMQINCTKIPDVNSLLDDCHFACDNSLRCLINTSVKVEDIETLIIKNEVENDEVENVPQFDLVTLPPHSSSNAKSRNLALQCLECNTFFKTQSGLASHKRSDHLKPNQEFICAICGNTYAMKYKLRRHLTVSHKQCTCDKCGLKLKRSSLTKHLKMHEPDYVPYKPPRNRRLCTVCGASVRYNFNKHMRKHREQESGVKVSVRGMIQCSSCQFETSHWTSLYRHRLRHKEKPFLCNTCGKDFSGKEFFDKHMRLHDPFDKPTACYVCAETFANEFDYGKHLSTHTYYVRKLTNFEEYSKRKQKYKKRSTTTNKNITSSDEAQQPKPKRVPNPSLRKVKTTYKCEPCNKVFKDNAHLQIHVTAIHENKREHKCPYCGKGFNLPNSLQEHIRTHTGETLKCDYCEKTFKQNSTRYKHLREAHNVHLGQIRKEKSKERKEKDDIRKAYKKLKMKLEDAKDLQCTDLNVKK